MERSFLFTNAWYVFSDVFSTHYIRTDLSLNCELTANIHVGSAADPLLPPSLPWVSLASAPLPIVAAGIRASLASPPLSRLPHWPCPSHPHQENFLRRRKNSSHYLYIIFVILVLLLEQHRSAH